LVHGSVNERVHPLGRAASATEALVRPIPTSASNKADDAANPFLFPETTIFTLKRPLRVVTDTVRSRRRPKLVPLTAGCQAADETHVM
jgi:hypothetical protein